MPLKLIHRVYQIFLKVVGVPKHTSLITPVFTCLTVTVIQIVERCKTLENVSVLFPKIQLLEVAEQRAPYAYSVGTQTARLIFLGREMQPREPAPLSPLH